MINQSSYYETTITYLTIHLLLLLQDEIYAKYARKINLNRFNIFIVANLIKIKKNIDVLHQERQ